MSFLQRYLSLFIAFFLFLGVGLANGQWHTRAGQKKTVPYSLTITVDQSGHGNFRKIQYAINSIPSYNMHWVLIRVKAGIYREKIVIPRDKPYIFLKGEGKSRTQVVWGDHDNLAQSSTFASSADNIVVKAIGFTGRHYYKNCTIEGAVDFIFGGGQSMFEQCSISVNGAALGPAFVGFITAQGRTYNNEASRFVFKNCKVYGTGKVFLGRAWRPYSRVLFYHSYLSDVKVPQGWDAWRFVGYEGQLTFAEDSCYGPGSNTSWRVRWEKKLSPRAVRMLTSGMFIDGEGWLQRMPL